MSYTEIFKFDKEGNAEAVAEIRNSTRGFMAIWKYMEEKHLPAYRPSYIPARIPDSGIEHYCRYKPTRCTEMMDQNKALQEVWDLAENLDVPVEERIAMITTFDNCLVRKENFSAVIKAFRSFKGETSLPEQADVLEKLLQDENCIAVGWNQTSVNGDTWGSFVYAEETEEDIPYNCLNGDKHFWITEYQLT